jgi:hypothetical protein
MRRKIRVRIRLLLQILYHLSIRLNLILTIHLKNPCLLASKFDIADLDVNITPCSAIICKEVMFSFEDMPPSLLAVANLLQEFMDVFPQDVPPGLPPIRAIETKLT